MSSDASPSNGSSMPQADIDFLMACLNNTTGGSVTVDIKKVAEELNYTNHRSANNRLAALRKKYNLPLSGTTGGSATGAEGSSEKITTPKKAKTPKTPTEKKAKVTKAASAKTPSKARKGKAKVEEKIASEEDGDEFDEEVNEQEDIQEDLAVKSGNEDAGDEISDEAL